MRCFRCNKSIDNDSQFCVFCGAKVVNQSAKTDSETIRIGRALDNDHVLNNPRVSLHHCELHVDSMGKLSIKDVDSSNGVFVNGERIAERKIKVDDIVSLGKSIILDIGSLISDRSQTYSDSEVVHKPNTGLINKDKINIGRDHDNDIRISNIRVSRHHARLERIGVAWQIIDLDSANGTFVNGIRVKNSIISEQDSITVGGVPLDLISLFSRELPDWSADLNLSGENLSFKVGNKTIVEPLNICLQPGQFIGLIGPSGCGKTTLMMMLNGYLKPSSGNVYINGVSLHHNPQAFQGQIGYVPQDDIIHRELTVEESLLYTSKLRLGDNITDHERSHQIAQILDALGLTMVKDTLIGSPEKKGVSGGQRKRVNMAQELVTEPLFYFLDEPTSGLDPRSDKEVMKLLSDLTRRGHAVLLTTHKIDALNFSIFTHLLILSPGGKLAYFGPACDAVPYFGVSRPEDIFDVLEGTESGHLQQNYLQSNYYQACIQSRMIKFNESNTKTDSRADVVHSVQADAFHQFLVLCQRTFLVKCRDHFSAAVLLLQAPIIGLFIYLVFKSSESFQALYFVLVVAAIWLGCSNSAREIVSEQTIFKREQKASLSLDAYLWSKICVLSMLCMLQCLILSLFTLLTVSINISFGLLFIALSLTSIAALTMGLLLSAVVKTGETAMAIVPVALIPQVILGGLIVPFGSIPEGVNILAGFMLSRWAFELLIVLENSSFLTDRIGFNSNNLPIDLVLILIMSVSFIFLTRIVLNKKMR
ncbi:MAG: FHA domain-containing protein [Gammaproteobacteria bacterium]